MEDPKRLRTKLRLDLNEVQQQIEEIEDQMRSDKSSDTIERHKKLVEYEKKLKDQYEKIAGITIDQASTLDEKQVFSILRTKESRFSRFLGFVAGLLLFNGFYNLSIHAYVGFSVNDYIDYLSGNGTSIGSFDTLSSSFLFDSSTNLIVYPILSSLTLLFLGSILSTSGSKIYKLMQFLAISIPVGYLLSFILLEDNVTDLTAAFDDNMLNLGVAFIFGGLIYLFALFDDRSGLSKIAVFFIGASVINTGVQILLAAFDTNPLLELLYTWPWIMLPMLVSSILISLENLVRT